MDEVGSMSDEKEFFSLTELAEDTEISWRNYLSKAIRKGRDIFVRLKDLEFLNIHSSRLTLNSLEEMNKFRTTDGYDFPEYVQIHEHYIAWTPYWLLPKTELLKLLRDMPLWEIRRVTPTWVLIENSEGKFEEKEINELDRNAYTSYIEPVLIDENNIFLFKPTDETEKQSIDEKKIIAEKRKPHTAYAVHEIESGTKPIVAWNKLKQLASESKGEKQVKLPGYGLIYLKRDKNDPEQVVRYKHVPFESPDDGDNINHGAFKTAWTTETTRKRKETGRKQVGNR